MVTVLIADDNAIFNLSLSSFLTKEKDIKIVDMCLDGQTALLSYLDNKPDVMILDLDMPSLNGVKILEYLDNIDEEKQLSNIIIISGSTRLKSKLSSLSKVYCILNKPCNLSDVLKKVQEIKKYSTYTDSLKLTIFHYLQNLNFNMNSVGTIYLSEMILFNLNHNNYYNLKTLIHKVASKNNISNITVKSAVYHSVDTMNRFVNIDNIKRIYPNYDGRKLTPSDIIGLSRVAL